MLKEGGDLIKFEVWMIEFVGRPTSQDPTWCVLTNTHKYTNTRPHLVRTHKYTNTQIHIYTYKTPPGAYSVPVAHPS